MTEPTLDVGDILARVAHRYPFLLIDRVLTLDLDAQKIVGLKNVTINEPFFQGHFRDAPVMPGVLVVEAMVQACGMLSYALLDTSADEGVLFYFTGIDGVRFRKMVLPGDQLKTSAELLARRGPMWKFRAVARVDDRVVCEGNLMCVCQEKPVEQNS
jgi:3-hydroxyacyl-[acyl-carrier-protein] dehydratase